MTTAHRTSRQIVLLVEGRSERASVSAFLHKWLDRQLPEGHKVGLHAVRFEGVSAYLKDVAQKTAAHLGSHTADYVFGLVDLHGLQHHFTFPRDATVAEKVEVARRQIVSLIPKEHRAAFRQHFAVHEFEAWLLAYPDQWPPDIRGQIEKRKPEEVDFDEPPAKFLSRLFKGKGGYKKTTQARRILSSVDPRAAIEQCPHLRQLADDLLRAARDLQ